MTTQSVGLLSSAHCASPFPSFHGSLNTNTHRGAALRKLPWGRTALAWILLLAGAVVASAQAPTLQANWTQLSPGPQQRYFPGMTYDAGHSQVVLFGGTNGGTFLNDTWLWNGNSWAPANPVSSPSVRSAFAMTFDAAHSQVVLFGGRPAASGADNDTWLWNGTTWTQATPGTIPPARSNNAMVYDAATGNVVMFGGLVGGLGANDTWIWNGSNWTQMFPSVSPSPRSSYSMAYDPVHQQVVLFGGFDQFGNNLADTWVWTGNNWTPMSPPASPAPRFGQGMAWDASLNQIVLFGGTDGTHYFGDTWSWNGANWIQRTVSTNPPAREAFGMASDAAQNQVLLFGGFNGATFFPDTWQWSTSQNFGNVNVCPSSTLTPPPCNNTLTLTYNLAASTTFGNPQVVTQGTGGLDFSLAAGSTCTGAVSALSCTINVTFTPQAPGLRTGAVELFDSTGNLLVTTLIYGNGHAPQAVFTPATQTVFLPTGTLIGPEGMAVDAAGDVFVADSGNARVLEISAGNAQSSLGFNLNVPQALALDGAGNLYIADNNTSGTITEIPHGCTTSACQKAIPTGLPAIVGVAVDGLGDLFVSDFNDGEVAEIPANGGVAAALYKVAGSAPKGLAVDSAGDVFFAAFGFGQVLEIPAGCANSNCAVKIGLGWSEPDGVAVDAAGDVYVADQGLSEIVEVPAGCNTGVCQIVVESGKQTFDPALDAQGNIYYANFGTGELNKAIVQAFALALGFGSQTDGTQSSPQSFTLQNIGNQTLSAISPGLQITGGEFVQVNASSPGNCTATFSLGPGAVCNTSIAFFPLSPGPYSDFVNFTDNSLNASPATQPINLVGTGVAPTYTLTVTPMGAGAGTVTSSDGFINCSISNGTVTGTCSKTYASPPANLTVTAAAASGSTFQVWGGACSGVYPICSLSVAPTTTVTATFNPIHFAVTAPTTAVNATSAIGTATVNFTGSGTLGAVAVVTQGAANKDFNFAEGGSCAVGTPYSVSQTCTVNYSFTPLAPGARKGAVLLTDSSGNVLGTTYLSGIGTGPQGLFDTTPQSLSISGLSMVRGLSLDGNSNLYAFETCSGTCSGTLDEFTAGTSTRVQVTSLPDTLFTAATAVDGAGNVFVSTNQGTGNQGILYELVGGKAPAVQLTTIPDADNNLEIDGAGNLFFTGYHNGNDGAIYELPAGSTQVITLVPSVTGRRFIGMAIDAAGDLFAADFNNNVLYELPAGTNSLVSLVTGGLLVNPDGVALDPAGNIYVTNISGSSVIRYAAGTYAATLLPEAGQRGIALDSSGNMYTITSDSTIAGYTRTQATPLTFANTNVGATSNSQQSILFENDGNTALNITSYSATAPFAVGGPQNTCVAGAFASGASCAVGATFSPTAAGAVGGTATIADNNLGVSATQTISLSGTGVTVTTYALTVTPIGSGAGTITDNSNAISCTLANGNFTGLCSANYSSGTQVILTAKPSLGSIFLGWGGGCTGFAPTCQVSSTQTVTASFSQQNFGNINVCAPGQSTPAPCSASIPVTINIPTTTTIGVIQVVTQGVTGLDFSLAGAGTCTGTITGGNACTLNVNFNALAPGSRLGAVELYDASGTPVVTVPIYGIGQAPAAAFSPDAPVPVNTGAFALDYPAGLLTDAAGNLFIANGDNSNRVLKVAPNGSISTVGFNFNLPQGMAEDGAGNLYVANNNLNEVIEVPAGCATYSCQVVLASNLQAQLGVAVDGAGDLFVGEFTQGQVVEIPAGCTSNACQQIIYSHAPAVASTPVDLTADAAGDVFFADEAQAKVIEIPAGCTVAGCLKTIGVGWAQPDGVAVDAAGNVYVADQKLQQVVEVPVNCTTSACQIVLASGIRAVAVAVDGEGNLFADNITTNQVLKINRSLPPSLSFALTNVGSTSTDSPQSITLQNVGNQTLTASLSARNSAHFLQSGTCDGTVSLAPGATCTDAFSFAPQNTGYLTTNLSFADTTFNLSQSLSMQPFTLSGTGGLNGQAVAAVVPNVVGMTQSAATQAITTAGLTLGAVSSGYSSSEPAGTIFGESPAAGTVVNPGSAVAIRISIGQAPPPAPNPLTLESNTFVTGDFATAGVTLHGTGVNGKATATINIPVSTGPASPGVPTGADIVDGWLYWTVLENTATPSGNTGTFLGYSITGQQVGKDLPYTDGAFTGTLRVYRANVNTYFQDGPNGIRIGSGAFPISLPDGTGSQSGFPIQEGANLAIIYRVLSPNFPLKAVVIYDGSALPAVSTNQTVQGFYDAVGPNGPSQLAILSYAPGAWSGSSSTVFPGFHASSYSVPLNPGSAYAAVIFSTPVNNSDNDGILDAWKAGPLSGDFFAGQPGYYDVKTNSWVALPGAKHGQKDLFVQLDYMCGAVLPDGTCDPTKENLFPSPDSSGNDPLAMVQKAFTQTGIALHLEIGNAVPEDTCSDSNGQLCQFPNEPGVIGWKNSLEFSKIWPRNLTSCANGNDCTARFPYGQKDSYHYVLFGHSLAIPAWNSRYGSLTSIQVANNVTTISTIDRGTGINACPARLTIAGVLSNSALNGVYNTQSCPDSKTIIVATPGVPNWSWSFATNTPPEPAIGITFGQVTSISGYSDLGGADSAVTLGLWETSGQDQSKRANVIAGTLFHEIGHTLGLSHGGLYYDGGTGNYVPTFEANCKPNYQSDMNYLFQLDGVGPNAAVAFSTQTLNTLTQSSLGSVTQLTDISNAAATFPTSAWYVPFNSSTTTASPATLHCDGTPLNGDSYYRVDGPIAPIAPAWTNGQNITFDGVPYTTLRGYNDVANLDLRQLGATGGEFASLASVISFGSSANQETIQAGGNVTLGSGGTVTLGSGGNVTLGSGGNVTLGSGGTVTPGSGGTVAINNGGTVTMSTGGVITLGSGGNVTLGSGGNVTLGSGGVITLGSGGNVTLGSGGVITLGSGGTITSSLGTVTIPSTGGTYTLPSGGGVVTLGSGGNVTLGSGGNVTLGSGGTITLGSGGNVTLGSGGTVTLGSGGVIALGSGGNVTLGSGGNVTLGSGGVVTLGSGGVITLGSGGNVTLGSGGTVTLGSGGSLTMNSAGVVTLGSGGGLINGVQEPAGTYNVSAGGVVTLGSGGTVTLGSGGNVTLGSGGNVTLGSGGVVALGSGGNVTLGSGGNVTLGSGGAMTNELDFSTANSIVRPPTSPTETTTVVGNVINWNPPAFGVVQTYTVYRSVNGGPAIVIGSVSGINGNPPATTFTDTNPPIGTLVYTITTTLVPDSQNSTPRQSPQSTPAVVTYNQTIVLSPLPSSVPLSTGSIGVSATVNSGAPSGSTFPPVTFTAAGPCSVSNPSTTNAVTTATVNFVNPGSCTITASQAGGAVGNPPTSYNAADPVSGTFTILPPGSNTTSQSINFAQLPNVQYGGTFTPNATATSGETVSFTAKGPCTSTGMTTGVGLCTITASAPGGAGPNNTTFSPATASQSFTVYPAVITVTATSFAITYGQPIPTLTYTLSGFVNNDPTSVVTGAPALSTTATATSNAGSYPITVATGSLAATNYSFLFVPGTLSITMANQAALVLSAASPLTYNQSEALTLTGGSTNGTVTWSVSGPCSRTNIQITANSGTGSCTVSAMMAGNNNYNSVTSNTATITLQPAAQMITFTTNPPASAPFNTKFTVAAIGGGSGNPVVFTSSGACSNSGATYTMTSGAGTCSVIANQAGNTNYAAAPQVTIAVTATPGTLTSGTNCNGIYTGTFNGSITVSPGQSCTFVNGHITGSVQQKGGSLSLQGTLVSASVQITGSSQFFIGPSSTVSGSLQITSIPTGAAQNQVCGATIMQSLIVQSDGTALNIGSASSCAPNQIGASLQVSSSAGSITMIGNSVTNGLQVSTNSGPTVINANHVGSSLQDTGNTGATQVFSNVIKYSLQCSNNTSITGGSNTAQSKQGQCAKF